MSTLRLKFPQWQGAWPDAAAKVYSELELLESTRGYFQGASIIQLLAPPHSGPTAEVPVPFEETEEDLETVDGIYARRAILRQIKQSIEILNKENPAKVCVFGGDCSTSTPVFSWLAHKYPDDCAVIWYDAYPDISCPGEGYPGFHAMALSHILGVGDKEVLEALPGRVPPSRALIVGFRYTSDKESMKRIAELGVKTLPPAEFRKDPSAVNEWVKESGVKRVLVHLDVDVFDPVETRMNNWSEPDGMKIAEVVESIRNLSQVAEVACLTLAEHIPIVELQLQRMLKSLPLFQ